MSDLRAPVRSESRAWDVGYGWTKLSLSEFTREGSRLHVPVTAFQSAPFPKPRAFGIEHVTSVEMTMAAVGTTTTAQRASAHTLTPVRIDGVEYCVSDAPSKFVPEISSRVRGPDYVRSKSYRICMAAAAKLTGLREIKCLILGTPVANFESAKTALLAQYADGVRYDDTEVTIGSLKVLPRPMGGLVWHYLSQQRSAEIGEHQRLLIDVGYGTLDWVVSSGLNANTALSGSSHLGVSAYVDALSHEITQGVRGFGENLALADAIDKLLVLDRAFDYKGVRRQRTEFIGLITQIAHQAIQQIMSSIGNVDLLSAVVLMGGGAALMEDALKRAFAHLPLERIAAPQFANVRGFQMIAQHHGGWVS
jgi:plasmid segregation protein ParM